jgi:hypothetical protein
VRGTVAAGQPLGDVIGVVDPLSQVAVFAYDSNKSICRALHSRRNIVFAIESESPGQRLEVGGSVRAVAATRPLVDPVLFVQQIVAVAAARS